MRSRAKLAIPVSQAIIALILLLVPEVSRASQVEEFVHLSINPSDPARMVLTYKTDSSGGGFFFTHDGGQSWQLMCSSVRGPGLKVDHGPVVMLPDGTTLVGATDGLFLTREGCDWSMAPGMSGVIYDIAPDPRDPATVFIAMNDPAAFKSQVFRRDPSGAFRAVGTRTAGIISRLRVAARPDGAVRIYESVARDATNGSQTYVIRVSDDEGQSFSEHDVTQENGAVVQLEAVDPSRPDRIVVSAINTSLQFSHVLVSSDQGATLTDYLGLTRFGGLAIAADGRVWIADWGNYSALTLPRGLWVAESLDDEPQSVLGDRGISCVTAEPNRGTLFVCSRKLLPEFGTFDANRGTLRNTFDFLAAKEFVSCPGVDIAAQCDTQLCGEYCGPMHYACARVCDVYQKSTCGPNAAALDRDTDWDVEGCSAVPMRGAAGDSAGSGATGGSAGSNPIAGSAASGTTAPKQPSGGCSVPPAIDDERFPMLSGAAVCLIVGYWRRRALRRAYSTRAKCAPAVA